MRGPLAAWLSAQADELHGLLGPYRVLDVGCGQKPYLPFFAPSALEYVGIDSVENPAAEVQGSIEDLPFADDSFDVVVCTQVLEHCDDPALAVSELHRVTRPGGRVLLSTHGVQAYHPSPVDHWRWTHTGLERLFAMSADWASVEVTAASGTASCLGMLVAVYLGLALKRVHARPLARPIVWAVNSAAATLDARLGNPHRAGALVANYHVKAEPAGARG